MAPIKVQASKRKLEKLKVLPTITEESCADLEKESSSVSGDSECKEAFKSTKLVSTLAESNISDDINTRSCSEDDVV